MYTVLKLCRPFEGNREADVAPGEHECGTPALEEVAGFCSGARLRGGFSLTRGGVRQRPGLLFQSCG